MASTCERSDKKAQSPEITLCQLFLVSTVLLNFPLNNANASFQFFPRLRTVGCFETLEEPKIG